MTQLHTTEPGFKRSRGGSFLLGTFISLFTLLRTDTATDEAPRWSVQMTVGAGIGDGQPFSAEKVQIREAADQAYRELEGELLPESPPANQLFNLLRRRTREAPLQALAIAFILGVMASRR
jgi:hypothetical protein